MSKTKGFTEIQKRRIEQRIRQLRAKEYSKEMLAIKSKERRDEWIGHKLGNLMTNNEFANKETKQESEKLMQCKLISKIIYTCLLAVHLGAIPIDHADTHAF